MDFEVLAALFHVFSARHGGAPLTLFRELDELPGEAAPDPEVMGEGPLAGLLYSPDTGRAVAVCFTARPSQVEALCSPASQGRA